MRRLQLSLLAFSLIGVLSCASWLSSGGGGVQPPPGPVGPSQTLPGSLHGTAGGMQWWYEQPDGAGAVLGVSWEATGCGDCHVQSCDQCHTDATGTGPVNEPDACKGCHGRQAKEEQLGVTDLHLEAGMACSDCHSTGDMHGDGTTYDSMLASPNASCENCHSKNGSATDVPATQSHTVHGDTVGCDACHMSSAVTCYNCHLETLLDSGEKKAAAAFKDFIILLNDNNGKVRAGTYQSVVYQDKGFVAYGPFHGHSVESEGRACADCHGGPRMLEYKDTGKIVMSWWDEGEGKVMHTDGVIPFVPDDMEFQFVTLEGENWVPIELATSAVAHSYQAEFCSPLTQDQLESLGAAEGEEPGGPATTLPDSLHGTARGMQWWYEQPDGAGAMFGVDYAATGCGNCHTAGCDDCHENADGSGAVDQPTVCKNCHGRINKEADLSLSDLHLDAGLLCSDCHPLHEIHGDGNTYNSMFEAYELDPQCVDCHEVPDDGGDPYGPHNVHGDALLCDACHLESVITCYNCHLQTLLDTSEKKAAAGFKDFIFLLNDQFGKVRAGSYQSVFYDGKGFAAFGPFHGHTVTAAGRDCGECHGGPRMQEYHLTGEVLVTWWDEGEGKVMHATGVIPFVPEALRFQFLDFDGENWSPVTPSAEQIQYKFCSPLSEEQLDSLALAWPGDTLAGSLHGTSAGMQWWYEQPDGLGSLITANYEATGCGNCHVDTEAEDGGCSECHGEADVHDPIVNQGELCRGCHSRQNTEFNMGLDDVHFQAGMECSDCHLYDIHGDGVNYNSMLEDGAIKADCENCHTELNMTINEHSTHADELHCDACHLDTVITCYNCHFDSLLAEGVKRAHRQFNDFILLVNETSSGKVRAGTYQSVIEGGDNTFIAFGPFHGHSIQAAGRVCNDCHNNERITELNDNGEIVMTYWDAGGDPPGIVHTTGVVPFDPTVLEFEFVDYDSGLETWSSVGTTVDQMQWEFCTPLTADQLAALGVE